MLLALCGGDEESRTPDPLLARQVLSQLSYTPTCLFRLAVFVPLTYSLLLLKVTGGLKWARTTDLTLIRRVL